MVEYSASTAHHRTAMLLEKGFASAKNNKAPNRRDRNRSIREYSILLVFPASSHPPRTWQNESRHQTAPATSNRRQQ